MRSLNGTGYMATLKVLKHCCTFFPSIESPPSCIRGVWVLPGSWMLLRLRCTWTCRMIAGTLWLPGRRPPSSLSWYHATCALSRVQSLLCSLDDCGDVGQPGQLFRCDYPKELESLLSLRIYPIYAKRSQICDAFPQVKCNLCILSLYSGSSSPVMTLMTVSEYHQWI